MDQVNSLSIRVATTLLTLVLASTTRAQEEPRTPAIHGFGSWAYGYTSTNLYLAGAPGGNYRNSYFSLDVSAKVADRLRVVSQLFLEETSEATEAKMDYAFAEWRFSDALKLRAGVVMFPFGLSTETFDVGTLRPFLQLPSAIYAEVGIVTESLSGIAFKGLRPAGGWTLAYDFYGGGLRTEEFALPETFLKGEPISHESTETQVTKNVVGARLVVAPPVSGLSFGVSSFAGGEVGSDAGDEVGSDFRSVLGVHAEYLTDRWSIRSEFAHEKVRDKVDHKGFYVEAARRFGAHWQIAAQYNHLAMKMHLVPDPVAPSFLGHEEVVLGLNYWFHSAFVLKASYHRVEGNHFALPEADDLAAAVASGRLRKRTNLFQFGAQFSF